MRISLRHCGRMIRTRSPDRTVSPGDVARNLVGSIVKEHTADLNVLKEYNTLVAKKRGLNDKAWKEFHDTLSGQLG